MAKIGAAKLIAIFTLEEAIEITCPVFIQMKELVKCYNKNHQTLTDLMRMNNEPLI
jgi:hypothetical protein